MSRTTVQKDISDISVVANTPEGRRFIRRILDSSGMMQPAIVPELPDSSHYNMGLAALGQWLWNELLYAAPEALTWYITENAKELHTQPEEAEDE